MNIFLSILIRLPYFSPIRATYFFSFRAIIYIPRKAEAEDEKLDTTEHRAQKSDDSDEELTIMSSKRIAGMVAEEEEEV